MIEFKRILYPVDLSDSSAKIAPYVQSVAKKFESKIYILFAARVFDYFTGMYVPYPSISRFEKELIEGAEKRLYEFVPRLGDWGSGHVKRLTLHNKWPKNRPF